MFMPAANAPRPNKLRQLAIRDHTETVRHEFDQRPPSLSGCLRANVDRVVGFDISGMGEYHPRYAQLLKLGEFLKVVLQHGFFPQTKQSRAPERLKAAQVLACEPLPCLRQGENRRVLCDLIGRSLEHQIHVLSEW